MMGCAAARCCALCPGCIERKTNPMYVDFTCVDRGVQCRKGWQLGDNGEDWFKVLMFRLDLDWPWASVGWLA